MSALKLHRFLPEKLAKIWDEPLDWACVQFQINTPARRAAFLTQCLHESGHFLRLEENLRYRPAMLAAKFPRYVHSLEDAQNLCAAGPQAIASRIYANRMGNGDEASGEGWRYRGRGPIQVTGRNNYQRFSEDSGHDALNHPDALASDAPIAALSAAWAFSHLGCIPFADDGDIDNVSACINLGHKLRREEEKRQLFGLSERRGLYERCCTVFGVELEGA